MLVRRTVNGKSFTMFSQGDSAWLDLSHFDLPASTGRASTTTASSAVPKPGTECPPPRTAISIPSALPRQAGTQPVVAG